jgi:hypothetical protein
MWEIAAFPIKQAPITSAAQNDAKEAYGAGEAISK